MKTSIDRNVMFVLAQTVLTALLAFLLYRLISTRLGLEAVGVWSIVLAATSITRLSDFGLGASISRFVAKYLVDEETKFAAKAIDTVSITVGLVVLVAITLLYPVLQLLLGAIFQSDNLLLAIELLPFTALSLVINSVAMIFLGGLDGCRRMDLRALIVALGQGVMFLTSILLLPRFGLLGVAVGQIAQSAFLLTVGRLSLARQVPNLRIFPTYWNFSILRQVLPYSIQIQGSSFLTILLDPTAKALIGAYGGASAAGSFEVANQVVLRIRSLAIAANQPVVAFVSRMQELNGEGLSRLYATNRKLVGYAVMPGVALLICFDGLVSLSLLGYVDRSFEFVLALLAIAWGANTLTSPCYFFNQGLGSVTQNTWSHAVTGLLNLGIGLLVGPRLGVDAVMIGYATAIVIGSFYLMSAFRRRHPYVVEGTNLFSPFSGVLCISAALVSFTSWFGMNEGSLFFDVILPVAIIITALLTDPVRKLIWLFVSRLWSESWLGKE